MSSTFGLKRPSEALPFLVCNAKHRKARRRKLIISISIREECMTMKQLTLSRLLAFGWRTALILLLSLSSIVHAQTIITFDVPTSTETLPFAINPARQITGTYETYDGTNHNAHGFLRQPDGSFITFDVPGGAADLQGIHALAINQAGQITGYYKDASSTPPSGCPACFTRRGFLRQRDGTIITFAVPDAGTNNGQGTFPRAINSSGQITGEYFDANNHIHAFLRQPDGTFMPFD